MGVNACDRTGCENILCHRILSTQDHEYYVCSSCESELREAAEHWPKELTRAGLFSMIDAFMETYPEGAEKVEPTKELDALFRE